MDWIIGLLDWLRHDNSRSCVELHHIASLFLNSRSQFVGSACWSLFVLVLFLVVALALTVLLPNLSFGRYEYKYKYDPSPLLPPPRDTSLLTNSFAGHFPVPPFQSNLVSNWVLYQAAVFCLLLVQVEPLLWCLLSLEISFLLRHLVDFYCESSVSEMETSASANIPGQELLSREGIVWAWLPQTLTEISSRIISNPQTTIFKFMTSNLAVLFNILEPLAFYHMSPGALVKSFSIHMNVSSIPKKHNRPNCAKFWICVLRSCFSDSHTI